MPQITRRSAIAAAFASAIAGTATVAQAAPANVPSIWEGKKMYDSLLKDGTGFSNPGPAGRKKVHVFFDCQCPDCIRLMDRISPLYDQVEVVFYPIAFLNIHSDPQGAAILSAKDPFALLEEHHAHFRDKDFRGIRYDLSKISDEVRNKVWLNTKLHRRCGCRAVPYGVYLNSKGEYCPIDENLRTAELEKLLEL